MYEIMTADEAIRLIRDGDCICVNSFVGIENPIELHEAIYRRYQKMQSPTHLTMISSAGFGVWDDEDNAEGYIREGAVDKLICGHFGAMLSTKKLVLEDRFEAYNLLLGCISHAIRAQAGGLPGALSKVGLDIFVDPRKEGPGINRISIDDSLVKHVEVDGEEFLYYKLPKINIALIKGTAADRKGNITFDDMFMSGDALSICQAVKANRGPGAFAGIGGFANITSKTQTVVFCFSFTAKGLEVSQTKGIVTVEKEGAIPKFVDQVKSISFSARRAISNGQKVLYVTERCVFRLTPKGLKLIEVYPGIDVQKDILDLLPFEVEV